MKEGSPAKENGKLLKLFLSMLYISAFTFGGGFVIVTFMKRRFVDELHWLDSICVPDQLRDILCVIGPGIHHR